MRDTRPSRFERRLTNQLDYARAQVQAAEKRLADVTVEHALCEAGVWLPGYKLKYNGTKAPWYKREHAFNRAVEAWRRLASIEAMFVGIGKPIPGAGDRSIPSWTWARELVGR